jgi:hypothetical protein
MLGAATTPRLRLPRLSTAEALLLLAGRRTTKGMAIPIPKVVLLPAPIFSLFKTLTRACVSFITFTATKHTSALPLLLFGKLKRRRTFTGSMANSTHVTATAMHFPANAGITLHYIQALRYHYILHI